jgi:hypothetical protein
MAMLRSNEPSVDIAALLALATISADRTALKPEDMGHAPQDQAAQGGQEGGYARWTAWLAHAAGGICSYFRIAS